MIARLAKQAASSSSKRISGDSEYEKKRQLKQKADEKLIARRRARVHAARNSLSSPETDATKLLRHAHQYGAAVSKMNREKIGNPNKIKRMNRYPNPEPKRRQEKSLIEFQDNKGGRRSRGSGGSHKGQESRSSNHAAAAAEEKEKEKDKEKNASDASQQGWGVMYRYQAAKLQKENEAEKRKERKTRREMKEYLDKQVKRKEEYFVNKRNETIHWKLKNTNDHADWKQSIKSDKRRTLGKNLEIKKAREVQLKELEDRRMKERIALKEEDDRMMSRQRREKKRAAREKVKQRKEQDLALERVKIENQRVLREKAKVLDATWAEEAALDKQWKEILDKQERTRGARLEELKKKQESLYTIGLAQGSKMADLLAADEARAKRHQSALKKKEDEKAAAVEAKKKKMKQDMLTSLHEACALKEEVRIKQARHDAAFAAKLKKLNDIELDRMDHIDDGREAYVYVYVFFIFFFYFVAWKQYPNFVGSLSLFLLISTLSLLSVSSRRKKEWAASLDKQVAELRARKRKEGASMNDTEIRFNKLAMAEAEDYMKKFPPPKAKSVQLTTQPW